MVKNYKKEFGWWNVFTEAFRLQLYHFVFTLVVLRN